jgi:alpha-beta hydrolase superfamily lysophospholipase/SAM-dependent methyltransferase
MNTIMNSQTFQATDGATIRYKSWIPETGAQRALVLLHRGHEHADRWDSVMPGLTMPETAVFAWDARGHGESDGKRGQASCFMQYVRDLADFFAHIKARHGISEEQIVLVAHSVGAVIAATWVHDYAPQLAGLVMATPAFDINLIVPGALASIRLLLKVKPNAIIKSYVQGEWLTRDPAAAAAYDADTRISKDISARILVDLFDASRRVIGDAMVMDRPLLFFSATADRVVTRDSLNRFFTNYGATEKEHITLPDARHAIFHDFCRDEVTAAIRAFAERRFNTTPRPVLRHDLSHPATHAEYQSLLGPLPALSLKNINFAMQRLSMRTMGRLGHGIRVGLTTGFDSGESLDCIYENEARGGLGIGKLIDRGYLNAIGWRGIRQRRQCLNEALRECMHAVRRDGLPVSLMDVAGGAGRYLLDLIDDKSEGGGLTVLCRDWSETALATGRANATTRGLADRITHERGDAFDEASLAAVSPQPSVVVVSGLYELFPDNDPLRRSLRGIHAALPPGGWLIYTGQPWHPQVEMIARTLTNRDGKPWIMRRRPQGEMDALVREPGFTKQRQWTDDFGIFTVSIAQK